MMPRKLRKVAVLHYSVPPVIGGVENVILVHSRLFLEAGYPVTIITGRGDKEALPVGVELIHVPEIDSQHPQIIELSHQLEQGRVPEQFEEVVNWLSEKLTSLLTSLDILIVHNIFTKHFNLPLTAALFRLLDQGVIQHCVAWCHDITWTSPNSRGKVYEGYPWDLLRTPRSDITYVTVSRERQQDLAGLFGCPPEQIAVIYNGVDPDSLLGLTEAGQALIHRLGLWDSDLNLLMPVRVTKAKNIELALGLVAVLKTKGVHVKLVVTGPPDPHDDMNLKYFRSLLRLRRELGVIYEVRFVYESGRNPAEPMIIDTSMVAELLRVSDALFMPSHREGFGMPVLEAGMIGIPVFCAEPVPAANEIGGQHIVQFSPDADPGEVANLILKWMEHSSVLRLRRRIRQNFTWQNIFRREILPLLDRGAS
jgi:glycosyltransferase involved in cell wall biosynthesis